MEKINKKEIETKVLAIMNDVLTNGSDIEVNELSIQDKLNIIISESRQALELITTIEDEFDIELDDDDVDLDFFTDIELMTSRILKNINLLSDN